jgi:hypothetical protein
VSDDHFLPAPFPVTIPAPERATWPWRRLRSNREQRAAARAQAAREIVESYLTAYVEGLPDRIPVRLVSADGCTKDTDIAKGAFLATDVIDTALRTRARPLRDDEVADILPFACVRRYRRSGRREGRWVYEEDAR